jgi:RNA polymerase-binding transcription factor DksA
MADAHAGEPVFGANPADRGTDEYDMGAALSLISSEQNALFEIDQALRRIRDGTYGVCEATGKPIPAERLDAVPWTRFARDVEEKLEREEQARKPRHVL